jgi:alpha-tubulin suppressor-like RCC1 family protein
LIFFIYLKDGQTGDGSTIEKYRPTRIHSSLNGVVFVKVSAISLHTLYLSNQNRFYASGLNSGGRLGDGSTTSRSTPTLNALTDIIDISAGFSHSLVVKSDGTLYAFGSNSVLFFFSYLPEWTTWRWYTYTKIITS